MYYMRKPLLFMYYIVYTQNIVQNDYNGDVPLQTRILDGHSFPLRHLVIFWKRRVHEII